MTVLHVDMDAFFASVEQRDNPELRGKPVIVGAGPHERGVVSTCSYEARKFGVHSAMPSRTAYALCPHGIFVKPRMKAYQEASDKAFEVFEHYSPFVEGVSVDEAFLDVTGTVHLFGTARALGESLRREIREVCSLTCSVGLAPNRLLAKIASEEAKPDGLFETPSDPEGIARWLALKPVKTLWGVGKKTGEILNKYGFRTCGDIQRADPRFLSRIIGVAAARQLIDESFGRDDSPVDWEGAAEKSVSRELTFPVDATDREEVRSSLVELVGEVARRFRRETRWARTAKLKLRDGAFNTITRQARFELPARDDITFRHKALELFDREWPQGARRVVRLVGFGVTDIVFEPDDPEPSLFPSPAAAERDKRERIADVLDRIPSVGVLSAVPSVQTSGRHGRRE